MKQEQTKDNSALLGRLNIVQDATVANEGRIESLEKAVPEATKNLILENDTKLMGSKMLKIICTRMLKTLPVIPTS